MKQYRLRINGNDYEVAIDSLSQDRAEVRVNGEAYKVEIEKPHPAAVARAATAAAEAAPVAQAAAEAVAAPLPGVIISLKVKEGDTVRSGQVVAVLEAMKMENEIQAECDGIVTAVHVAEGNTIAEGEAIVTIQ